ncbi:MULTISPECIES: putative 2-aminoethylphosphonate ABC transporter substrate-binding protein [Clostridioides]|uniref:putative 2-aminoethylphosphonate ABC transporter substrate-binding protein n=1 Tax=Clostridioides sp. ZZV14-6387 TaxID=2811497 RepID=UPI0007BC5D41|nr:putative 2-aminoethylphosphonate ABC transporter substrate-binding protein [Clostridioides sp. ZZV14-6387]CZR98952.1 Iron deficiency-induced protein A precursor [Clostridioides difficile]CZS11582.1 Iron deficiency-induced protein A precursor [Clostridioides difficile]
MKFKKLISLGVLSTLLLSIITGCSDASSNSKSDNKSKGELTVYTAIEEDSIDTYLTTFKEKYPDVKLNVFRASVGDITARLLAEKDNPQADVLWGVAATSLIILDDQGMLEPYAPKDLDKINPVFKDDKEVPSWVGIDAWMTGITVNTKELKGKNIPIPSSYEDLTKPEYKGLISMPNPSSAGTGYLTVSAFIQIMGEEKAWEYMDKLHKNIGVYTQSGSAPAISAASGEYPIGISFGNRGIKLKEEGYPVQVVFPKEGSGWELESNALVKKDNIKEASKVFLDWAISKDVMNEYSKNFAVTTIDTGNPIPEGFPKKPLEQMIDNDLRLSARNREAILNKWVSKYDGKTEKDS